MDKITFLEINDDLLLQIKSLQEDLRPAKKLAKRETQNNILKEKLVSLLERTRVQDEYLRQCFQALKLNMYQAKETNSKVIQSYME